MKAAILGATGYTGLNLLRILSEHPHVDSIIPSSRSYTGSSVEEIDPGLGRSLRKKCAITDNLFIPPGEVMRFTPEVVFAALPHLESANICAPYVSSSVVIDLSADFRIPDIDLFHSSYGEPPPRKDLLPQSVYGLSEWNRTLIPEYSIIANPGCYPTATLLPLLPLLKEDLIKPELIVNALSGISGAGKKNKPNLLFCERSENTNAYAPGTRHRHVNEIKYYVKNIVSTELTLLFTPHLVPIKRGMAVTTVAPSAKSITEHAIGKCYRKYYGGSPFIRLRNQSIPETRDVWGSNCCDIGWHKEKNHLILFSVIDNLIKGASGQAVQNMNIRFGFDETAGLSTYGVF